jgi:hypothetical protein
MMLIPLQPVPSQTLNVSLASQACQIAVYQKTTGLYLDLSVAQRPIISCVLCRNRVLLVRQAYLGFLGDLSFIDTQGNADPVYSGLGTRYLLSYLVPSETGSPL